MHEIHRDPEVCRYLYNEPLTLDQTRERLTRKITADALRTEGDWMGCAVTLASSGELVADASLAWISATHRQGEIGFVVHPAHQGRGYATELARPLLAFGFEVCGFHRIVGRLEARNTGSARVLQKLGMRREAYLIENEWVKGEWQSELVYAMLAGEWDAPC
jgi:RimJ/RimL family protein N-acetyltransferase